jgi:hypothetical protein
VKKLAETITGKGATYNLQSDWNYLKAVAQYDVGSVTNDTGGKNILRWLVEDLGVEVDPHGHETQYNYADIAYLIEQLGVTPTKTVGGFIYDPPDNPQGWERHEAGFYGRVYPEYFWRADILWGAATGLHQGADDRSSGIWRPQDRYNFYVNGPNQRLIYIGGCSRLGQEQDIQTLIDEIAAGRAPQDGFYTATVTLAQDKITDQTITEVGQFVDSLADEVTAGRVRWATLSEMAEVWKTEYGARPFRFDCGSGATRPASNATIPSTAALGRSLIVGYNTNYLWGAPTSVSQAPREEFVATINRHIDLMERLGLMGEYYFTGLAAEKLAEWSPETVNRLLTSTHGLNYHGSNRPPYPAPVTFVRGQSWEEDVDLVRTYEQDGRNPRTGEHVGGLAAFQAVFGRSPLSTGRFVQASILSVSKDMGARMGVGVQENTGATRNDAWFLGVLNRPESISIEPESLIRAALQNRGGEYLNQLRAQLNGLGNALPVIAFLIHDHDLYDHSAADQEKVWTLYEQALGVFKESGFGPISLQTLAAMVQNGPAPTLTKAVLLEAGQTLSQTMAATGFPPDSVTTADGTPYSLAEVFEALGRALATFRQTGGLPDTVATHDVIGPTTDFTSRASTTTLSADAVLSAAVAVVGGLTDRFPSQVAVGNQTVNPAEFLYVMAQEYQAIAQGAPAPVTLRSINVLPQSVVQNRRADALT